MSITKPKQGYTNMYQHYIHNIINSLKSYTTKKYSSLQNVDSKIRFLFWGVNPNNPSPCLRAC